MKRTVSPLQLCLVAMAVCINVAGGQLALTLRLPVYLDSIGTILTGAMMGPFFGMLPNLISGLILGMTTDIYSLYFAPVGMVTGALTGLVFERFSPQKSRLFLAAFLITLPATFLSASICAALFGGITSSGSTILVQLLAKTGLSMTASVFAVQILTDYCDRLISLSAVLLVLRALPPDLRMKWKRGEHHGCSGKPIQ